jgi:hypothetical protein
MIVRALSDSVRGGYPSLVDRSTNPFVLWLARYCDAKTVVASPLGGELPYVIDAVHIDTLGLSDREIARRGRFDPDGPIDSKTDMAAVLDRRPDFVDGYFPASRILAGQTREEVIQFRRQMADQMLGHPSFAEEYLFVANAPYQSCDRALFVRKGYLASHPLGAEIETRTIAETGLVP